ncbi:MAG TPA: hypothetical protein VN706_14150 [Gemmatimonadaceae bacterium]|nr:hypothetical protein [Gemmatimonadaceae bacterium]
MTRPRAIGVLALAIAAAVILRWPRPTEAVSISPTAIYLSSRDRTASFELYNGDDTPAEVELSLAFGYPASDSLGRVDVHLLDSVPATEPSAVPWLRLFPRRVVLQPKQRQLVRVGAYPPAGIAVGEYWARLLVRSRPSPLPVEADKGRSARRPLMKIETLFITALNYRNGAVTTGVQVDSARARTTDSTLSLVLDMHRTGNAAYLGRLNVEVLSTSGAVVMQSAEDVAVYRSLRRIITFPLARGSASTFRYRLATERDDIDPSVVARAEPVSGQVRFAP